MRKIILSRITLYIALKMLTGVLSGSSLMIRTSPSLELVPAYHPELGEKEWIGGREE